MSALSGTSLNVSGSATILGDIACDSSTSNSLTTTNAIVSTLNVTNNIATKSYADLYIPTTTYPHANSLALGYTIGNGGNIYTPSSWVSGHSTTTFTIRNFGNVLITVAGVYIITIQGTIRHTNGTPGGQSSYLGFCSSSTGSPYGLLDSMHRAQTSGPDSITTLPLAMNFTYVQNIDAGTRYYLNIAYQNNTSNATVTGTGGYNIVRVA